MAEELATNPDEALCHVNDELKVLAWSLDTCI